MIADMLSNKKISPKVTESFVRGRKLNISVVFISQSYFAVLKKLDQMLRIILSWNFQQTRASAFNRI